MFGVEVTSKGDWRKTIKFLEEIQRKKHMQILEKYGQAGVEALSRATPVRTGKTAASWYYEITETAEGYRIDWNNSNVVNDWANIALLIQSGHGTRHGGYVQGIDYINPAMIPIFEQIANDAWEEVRLT